MPARRCATSAGVNACVTEVGNNPLPPPVIPDPTVPLMGRTVPPILPDPGNRETRGGDWVWPPMWPITKGRARKRPEPPPFSYVAQVVDEYVRRDMSIEQLENDLEIAILLDSGEAWAPDSRYLSSGILSFGEVRSFFAGGFERVPRYFKDREGRYLLCAHTRRPGTFRTAVGAADEVAGT